MRYFPALLISCVLIITGCGSEGQKTESKESASEETTEKNVSELEFLEALAIVLADTSNIREWHNSPVESEANQDLVLSMEESCGENDCGKRVYLVNNGSRTVSATITTVYPLEESPFQLAQVISIAAGDRVDLGCSHLCYGSASISFDRAIEGSSYSD